MLIPSPISVPVQLSSGLTITGGNGCRIVAEDVVCTPTASNNPPTFDLTANVAPDAAGDQKLGPATVGSGGVDGTLPLTPTDGGNFTVDPTLGGYTSITLDPGPLVPGTKTTLTITGNPAPGFTDPGPITLPNDLGSGVTIVGVMSGKCEIEKATTVCTPTPGTDPTTWVLNISVAAEPDPGTLAPVVILPGDRTLTTSAAPGVDLTVRGAQTPACPTNNVVALANGDFEAPVGQPGAPDFVENSDTTVWQSTALDPGVTSDHLIEFWQNGGNVPKRQQRHADRRPERNPMGRTQRKSAKLRCTRTSTTIQERRCAGPSGTGPGRPPCRTVRTSCRSRSARPTQISAPERSGPDISDGPAEWVKHTGTYKVPEVKP